MSTTLLSTRRWFPLILGLLGAYLWCPTVLAQGSIYDRPSVSPYLALTTNNSNSSLNYFTQVLPQIRARQAQVQTTSQIQSLRNRVTTVSRSAIQGSQQSQQRRTTGHPTRFNYYGSYYQQLNRQGPGPF